MLKSGGGGFINDPHKGELIIATTMNAIRPKEARFRISYNVFPYL